MVDREIRQAMRRGNGLGGDRPDQQTADQSRPCGRGHARKIAELEPGFGHRLRDQAVEDLDVCPRRDLRHHTAIRGMSLELAAQRLSEHPALGGDQGDAGLIAAGLDPEHDWRARRGRVARHDCWR
jgi:hypothetical protein